MTIGVLAALPQAAKAIPADVVNPAVEDKVKFGGKVNGSVEIVIPDNHILKV